MISKIEKTLSYIRRSQSEKLSHKFAKKIFISLSGFFASKKLILAYTPDSMAHFKAYPHIYELYERFRKFNKANNGGDINRLISIVLNLEQVLKEDNIKGSIAEVGVFKGNTACVLAYYANENQRKCFLFDTYNGFDNRDLEGIDKNEEERQFNDTNLEEVKSVIGDDLVKTCKFIAGYFPDSIPDYLDKENFAVVSLDCDLYKPTRAGLTWFYPRMKDGAIFLLHDYSSRFWEGSKKAIDEFCYETKQHVILLPDKSGSAFIRIHKLKPKSY
ncbi:TylF/MycF/NovP-related O-methyltransferase [Candidatus Pseudothioglobus sp. Uisw_050_01]|jgi:hypothetical protein|uniref:TylF/MycF/NovP-related O-methyltransferase n=1 Tax=Candidatus Pseudothioglobus sp. Uisw_050_01 TaxID=3230997 RepID=UPI003A89FD49